MCEEIAIHGQLSGLPVQKLLSTDSRLLNL